MKQRAGEKARQQTKKQQREGKSTSEPANLLALADGHGPQLGVVAKEPPMLIHQRGMNLILLAIHGLNKNKVKTRNSKASSRLLRSRHEPRGLETGKDTGEKEKSQEEEIEELTAAYSSVAASRLKAWFSSVRVRPNKLCSRLG